MGGGGVLVTTGNAWKIRLYIGGDAVKVHGATYENASGMTSIM